MSIAPFESALHDLTAIAQKGLEAVARVVLWALTEDEDDTEGDDD